MKGLKKTDILEILKEWNFWDKPVDKSVHRPQYIKQITDFLDNTKEVVVLKGIRRSGKSTLLKQVIEHYMERGYSKEQFLLANFEDPRFSNFLDVSLLEKVFETYREFVNLDKKCVILLDEVHYIKAWEKWVRKYRDIYFKDVKIIVTGSSAKLLDSEYATALTGRTLSVKVYPLSFWEYLEFNKLKLEKSELSLISNKRKILFFLNKYLQDGGFPEIVLTGNRKLFDEYFDSILYKDIIERYKIRDTASIKKIAAFLITNIGKEYSYNSLRKIFGVSLDLIREYISHIESSYMLFSLNIFSNSLKKQEINPKKIYCIDTGLTNAVSFRFSKDIGRIYENIVAAELKRKGKEIFYWRQRNEVDFLVREGLKPKELVQVCWNIEDTDTREREVKGLLEAMKEFKLRKGLIITEDFEKEEKVGSKKIKYVPLWRFLLEK